MVISKALKDSYVDFKTNDKIYKTQTDFKTQTNKDVFLLENQNPGATYTQISQRSLLTLQRQPDFLE